MKYYKIFKTVLFILGGILIFIFNEALMGENENCVPLLYLVGGVIAYYGVEGLVLNLMKRNETDKVKLVNSITYIILSFVLLFAILENIYMIAIVCVCWSVWSIMREGEEITEKVIEKAKHPLVAIINGVESIIVIVLSVLLMINPGAHHAHSHLILLGVELILEVLWEPLDELCEKSRLKREAR